MIYKQVYICKVFRLHRRLHAVCHYVADYKVDYLAECRLINYCWTKLCLFLDVRSEDHRSRSRVPGIRDEIPFPQAKQCSPELDFPSSQFSSPFSQKLQRLQEKPIVTDFANAAITQEVMIICSLLNYVKSCRSNTKKV